MPKENGITIAPTTTDEEIRTSYPKASKIKKRGPVRGKHRSDVKGAGARRFFGIHFHAGSGEHMIPKD